MDALNEKIQQAYEDTVINPKEEDLIEQYLSLLDKIENVGSQLDEKWPGKVEIKQTGEYSGKSVSELRKMLTKMKGQKPFPREKYSEVMFAIRAKTGWKKGEGAVGESEELSEARSDKEIIKMALDYVERHKLKLPELKAILKGRF